LGPEVGLLLALGNIRLSTYRTPPPARETNRAPARYLGILGGYLGACLALVIPPRHTKWLIAAVGLGLAA
jgi:hypothetical protein